MKAFESLDKSGSGCVRLGPPRITHIAFSFSQKNNILAERRLFFNAKKTHFPANNKPPPPPTSISGDLF